VTSHLPAPLVPAYLGVWTLLTPGRTRSVGGLRAWAGGFFEGVTQSAGRHRRLHRLRPWAAAGLARVWRVPSAMSLTWTKSRTR
jgi:hypothetical protein